MIDVNVARYLGRVRGGEEQLADALTHLASRHAAEPDVTSMLTRFADWSRTHIVRIDRFASDPAEQDSEDPQRLRSSLYDDARTGGVGLVQDLHDLSVQINSVRLGYQILEQVAKGMHNTELETTSSSSGQDLDRMTKWTKTKLKQAAPQALLVPADT